MGREEWLAVLLKEGLAHWETARCLFPVSVSWAVENPQSPNPASVRPHLRQACRRTKGATSSRSDLSGRGPWCQISSKQDLGTQSF